MDNKTPQQPFDKKAVEQVRNNLNNADKSTTLEITRETLRRANEVGVRQEEIRSVIDETWGSSR